MKIKKAVDIIEEELIVDLQSQIMYTSKLDKRINLIA